MTSNEPEYFVMLFFLLFLIILSAAVANISMYFVFVIVANLYVTVTDSNKSNNTALQCTSPEASEIGYACRGSFIYHYLHTSVIL